MDYENNMILADFYDYETLSLQLIWVSCTYVYSTECKIEPWIDETSFKNLKEDFIS